MTKKEIERQETPEWFKKWGWKVALIIMGLLFVFIVLPTSDKLLSDYDNYKMGNPTWQCTEWEETDDKSCFYNTEFTEIGDKCSYIGKDWKRVRDAPITPDGRLQCRDMKTEKCYNKKVCTQEMLVRAVK